MNIALFGGSFDPPHTGHIAVVEQALKQLPVDRLIVMPAYLNPFKSQSHAPAAKRLAWLRAIFDGVEKVEVSDFEIAKGRPVPTIETVRHFIGKAAALYVIIGADNLASLRKWKEFEALDAMVTWVVATRGDIAVPPEYIRLDVDRPVSSTRLREKIEHKKLPESVAEEIADFYMGISKKP
jgi:nicotinate-nucleotide adenylyltransferase